MKVREIRGRAVPVLAWVSYGCAVVGGTAASGTVLGGLVRDLADTVPWGWVPVVALLALVAMSAVDLLMDGVPNRPALYAAMVIPSAATAAPGRLGDTLTGWMTGLMGSVDGLLAEWLGVRSALGIAVACVVLAVILGRRVVRQTRTRGA